MSKGKKAAADSAPPAENHPLGVDGTLASPASQTVPPLEFLASIAATLAGGRKVDSVQAVALVDEALEIWDAAFAAHQRRFPKTATQKVIEARQQEVAILHANMGLSSASPGPTWLTEGTDRSPEKFPAPLSDFFRLILRQRTEADNMALFREFLEFYCRRLDSIERLVPFEDTAKPSVEKIVGLIEGFKKDKFSRDHWDFFARQFLDFRAKKLSARGRNAAAARHKKVQKRF